MFMQAIIIIFIYYYYFQKCQAWWRGMTVYWVPANVRASFESGFMGSFPLHLCIKLALAVNTENTKHQPVTSTPAGG